MKIVSDQNDNINNPKGLHIKTEPHWKPQHLTSNIERFLPCVNFIGDFSNLQHDSHDLLSRVDLLDEYGRSGWGASQDEAMFEVNTARNKTSPKDRLDEFYDAGLMRLVKNAYSKEYRFLAQCGFNHQI
jgi:hypothetical protein